MNKKILVAIALTIVAILIVVRIIPSLDVSQPIGDELFTMNGQNHPDGRKFLAQSFVPDENTIATIVVYSTYESPFPIPIRCGITTNVNHYFDDGDGAFLAVSNGVSTSGMIMFPFDNVPVYKDASYYFVLMLGDDDTVEIKYSDENPYSAGKMYLVTTTLSVYNDRDLRFIIDTEYSGDPNQKPIATFDWSGVQSVGEQILFDASDSYDPDGTIEEYRWNIGSDSWTSWTDDPKIMYTFTSEGSYDVWLDVKDNDGLYDQWLETIEISSSAPPSYSVHVTTMEHIDYGGSIIPDATVNLVGPITKSGKSDSSGFITFSNCPPGEYTVSVTKADYERWSGTSQLSDIDLVFVSENIPTSVTPPDGYNVDVFVKDSSGNVISNALVLLHSELIEYSTKTNEYGSAKFTEINGGSYNIVVTHSSFDDYTKSVIIDSNTHISVELSSDPSILSGLNILAAGISIGVGIFIVIIALVPSFALSHKYRILMIIFGAALASVLYVLLDMLGVML